MDSANSENSSSPHRHRSRRIRFRNRHRHYSDSVPQPTTTTSAAVADICLDSPEVVVISPAISTNHNHHHHRHHRRSHRHRRSLHLNPVSISCASTTATSGVNPNHHHNHHYHRHSLVRHLRNNTSNLIHNFQDRIMNRINESMMANNQPESNSTSNNFAVHYRNNNSNTDNTTTTQSASSIYPSLNEQIRMMNNQNEQNQNNRRYSSPSASNNNYDQLNEMHEFIGSQSIPGENISGGNGSGGMPYPHVYNPYAPPSPHSHHHHNHHHNSDHSNIFPFGGVSNFLNDPLSASLTTFSRVTKLVRSPTTQIFNGASAAYNLLSNPNTIFTRPPGSAERIYSGHYPEFSGRYPYPDNQDDDEQQQQQPARSNDSFIPHPPPVLPLISNSNPQNRLEPLDLQEFEGQQWTKDQFCQRIFKGGMVEDNQLRSRLWPIILGLYDDHQKEPDNCPITGKFEFDWSSHRSLFELYRNQWMAILPDQEKRFSLFRDRKSLIERDVIRCDRSHPFYSGESENLDKLRDLLLTYMMYDFDTGYVQGMSDLASPLLFVADGDVCKAFWYFVKVMQFTSNNFEMSQLTNHLQLKMLWMLIKLTDPIFAEYLAQNESINCYFAFRWIICQFKREFMKSNLDGYREVLVLWESIWTCGSMRRLFQNRQNNQTTDDDDQVEVGDEEELIPTDDYLEEDQPPSYLCATNNSTNSNDSELASRMDTALKINNPIELGAEEMVTTLKNNVVTPLAPAPLTTTIEEVDLIADVDIAELPSAIDHQNNEATTVPSTNNINENNSTTTRNSEQSSGSSSCYHPSNRQQQRRLSDHQLYVLCICLSIIRRERDLIMMNQYNASDILKHFNTLQLNSDLKDILLHAANIWSWLVFDGKEEMLYSAADNYDEEDDCFGVRRNHGSNPNNHSGNNQHNNIRTTTTSNNGRCSSVSSNVAETGSRDQSLTQPGGSTTNNNDSSSSNKNDCEDFDLLADLTYSPLPTTQSHQTSASRIQNNQTLRTNSNSSSAIDDFIFHTT